MLLVGHWFTLLVIEIGKTCKLQSAAIVFDPPCSKRLTLLAVKAYSDHWTSYYIRFQTILFRENTVTNFKYAYT